MALLVHIPGAHSEPSRLPPRPLLLTLGCALAVFVTLTLLVHSRLTVRFDRALLDLLVAPKGSWAAHVAVVFTTLGDAVPILTILVMAGVLVPVRWGGGWRLLVLPWASATIAFLLASGVKQALARARPPRAGWASPAHGFAFPSGHATTATAGFLVLAILISRLMPAAPHRILVIAGGVDLALMVGASRVVLGVHWPTDVLGGWALGTAVAAATLIATHRRPVAPQNLTPPQEPHQ